LTWCSGLGLGRVSTGIAAGGVWALIAIPLVFTLIIPETNPQEVIVNQEAIIQNGAKIVPNEAS